MKLTDIVSRGAIVTPLTSVERDHVVGELVDALVKSGSIDASMREPIYLRVLDRERTSSTGFGKGVAVPHAKDKRLGGMTAAIGLSSSGVEFNSLDRQPVYSVFLLISPEDQPNEHLRAMEAIFTHLRSDVFRRVLRQCHTPEDVWALLHEADSHKYGV